MPLPMDQVMGLLFTGMIIATVGLFLTTLGSLMATGQLPMNRAIGICVGSVTKSTEHWETGHRAAAPVNVAAGVVTQLLGLVVAFRPTYDMLTASLVGTAWAVVGLGALVAWRVAVQAVRPLG